ncbi:hypothetical protein GCM10010170_015610 [Dactylosporangium salmoneum]|uniref:Peptidase S53 domain-containing protein n=2 Tax=Dactylosporangium salmoneum TaxID=53361 RepID=A0ABP5SP26_9ACTN
MVALVAALLAGAATLASPAAAATDGPRRLGASAADVTVGVALKPRNQARLDALVAAVSDPSSPLYRHYLTAAEYNALFAPAQSDVDRVSAYLRGQGLTVQEVTGNRQVVVATGPAAAAGKAFHTAVSDFQAAGGGRFYAADAAPAVPAEIAGVTRAVTGLDSRPMFRHAAPTGPGGGYTPAQLRTAYSLTGLSGSYTGSGETVGLIEFDTFKQADIDTWTSQFGQPRVVPTVVKIDGGVSTPGSGQLEVTLDIDAVAATAPSASQIVYSAPNTDTAWVHEMARIASDNQITILSGSWLAGEKCESAPINASHDSYNQMVLQGVTLLSASGDWGATGCGYNGDNSTLQADYPASDPLFTGVGGTRLTTSDNAGTYSSETCWNQGGTGNTRSGGAYSSIFARPDWQTGSNQYRSVPDVALLADYSAGALSVNTNGSWQSVGGTSLSSPLWAGYVALLNQKARAAGKARLGALNPTLYSLAKGSSYTSLFHDVTSGSNGTYSAGTGYDLCTGWGSMKGDALGDALLGTTTPPPADFGLALSPTGGSVQPGASATTTVSTTAGTNPTGAITLTASGQPSGVTVSFAPATVNPGDSSTATIATTASAAAGTYTIHVTGTAGAVTHSADYSLTIGSTTPPPGDLALADPGTLTSTKGTSVSVAMHATGGTTPYRWTASGLPAGLSINPSTGVISGRPTTWANYYATVRVTDAGGATASRSFYWFIFPF